MKPVLSSSIYLFCTIPFAEGKEKNEERSALPELPKDVFVQCIFREEEGWSIVVKQDKHIALSEEERKVGGESQWGDLWKGLKPQYEDQTNRWSLITLNVHSSLLAVGFIAAVSDRFGKEGMLCHFPPYICIHFWILVSFDDFVLVDLSLGRVNFEFVSKARVITDVVL